jgi:hypothetical protein
MLHTDGSLAQVAQRRQASTGAGRNDGRGISRCWVPDSWHITVNEWGFTGRSGGVFGPGVYRCAGIASLSVRAQRAGKGKALKTYWAKAFAAVLSSPRSRRRKRP